MAYSSWIKSFKSSTQVNLRLFCFPYAGGSASSFRSWPAQLPYGIEVCAVQLPGREERIREPPFTKLRELVETMEPLLLPYFDIPFAFFGHSMGALISFEIARALFSLYGFGPSYLFVSACRAPQLPNRHPLIHTLADPEFLRELRHLGGTSNEVLQNRELMKLFIPLLRADVALFETYSYTSLAPLKCPILAFGGCQDNEVSYEEIMGWREQTEDVFTLHMLSGDHFIINSMRTLMLTELSRVLMQFLREH